MRLNFEEPLGMRVGGSPQIGDVRALTGAERSRDLGLGKECVPAEVPFEYRSGQSHFGEQRGALVRTLHRSPRDLLPAKFILASAGLKRRNPQQVHLERAV